VSPAQFRRRYSEAFAAFLRERSEQSLRSAYELGRDAVKADFSVLEIAGAHHDSLGRALAGANRDDAVSICAAAGDFLAESLAAYEMVQRGYSDARRAALIERRNARMLRQLSALLADESLAAGDRDSLEEVLQVVAEHAREMTDARSSVVRIGPEAGRTVWLEARSESEDDDTWSEVLQPAKARSAPGAGEPQSMRVELLSLDGSPIGFAEVDDSQNGAFSTVDEAVLTQVAQMAAAAVERALAYTDIPG
jgi:Phosphoserine phosphatase RsbU, N-terminal domain